MFRKLLIFERVSERHLESACDFRRADVSKRTSRSAQRKMSIAKTNHSAALLRVLKLVAGLLIFKVTVGVVLNYRNYFPPNFDSDFLRGRESYFSGIYQWAFYTHIASGPISLILGMILINKRFRGTYPKWHRSLGRIQSLCILFLVTPSGLWMAYHAETGGIAGFGFATLAVVTATTVVLGWRSAVKRRFVDHRRWMWRCYLMLCSAVLLRVFGGLATVANVEGEWVYQLSAWSSWLLPLMAFELIECRGFKNHPLDHSLQSR